MSICLALTDVDWSVTKDVFTVFGTLISAVTVGVAIYFGREGLHTWRKQLRGSSDHDLARRLLIELYKHRDSIKRARSPVIFSFEGRPFEGETESADPRQARFNSSARAYRRRLIEMDDARNPLQATMLEAEAVWGQDLKNMMDSVFKLEREFVVFVHIHLELIQPDSNVNRHELLSGRRDVLYALDSDGDVFWADMLKALGSVEDHLRSRLIPN